jgi:hypothetical protein
MVGTGILWRKQLSHEDEVLTSPESRITAITINSASGPVLFVNVYMPIDYGDSEWSENYLDICSNVNSLFTYTDFIFIYLSPVTLTAKLDIDFIPCFCSWSMILSSLISID